MPNVTPLLSVQNVSKTFPTHDGRLHVLEPMVFDVGAGEFVAIVGPSGCGKTTLLRIIAGIDKPDQGSVEWGTPIGKRVRLSFAFQHLALFPWHTVAGNIRFPLDKLQAEDDLDGRVGQMIRDYGLEGFEKYYPGQISGGMRQRVALARAMIAEPQLLILDEPFGALDVCARLKLQELVLSTCVPLGTSVLMVTHDLYEAVRLCQRIVVLSARPAKIATVISTGSWSHEERLRITPAQAAPYVEQLHDVLTQHS
jgi:ABC-type nitrate/sulfonate/bicarbonate transport system ATPase subunit